MSLHTPLEMAGAFLLCGAGAVVAMAPPDYAAIGVAVIGGIIGSLLAMAKFPEVTRSATYAKGACCWLFAVAFAPATFQYLAAHGYIPPLAEVMVALSAAMSFSAWASMEVVHKIWLRYVRKKLEATLNLPPQPTPRRRSTDPAKFAKDNRPEQ